MKNTSRLALPPARGSFARLTHKLRSMSRWYSIGGAVVLLAVIIVGAQAFLRKAPAPETPSALTHVRVASVGSLTNDATPLSLTGTVTSLNQATVLSESSGQIVSLPRKLGDYVTAGQVIATFENASEQAAVLQAEGSYDIATANLARVNGSASENNTVTLLAALQSAYAALDDAIHVRADLLFSNPKAEPKLVLTVPDGKLSAELEQSRPVLESVIADARALSEGATAANVKAYSDRMIKDANAVIAFLDKLIAAVNKTPPSQGASADTLAGYQASLAMARTEAVGAISSVNAAQSAYDANDVSAALAAVKQAKGALDAAKANLEKTIVRSPISGAIISLPINRGDYVSMNTQIAVISNPGALYVKTHVTPDDAKTIAAGNTVRIIDGVTNGIVTFIAPALDPTTGKIEVKIGITGTIQSLTDGEIVTLSIDRSAKTLSHQGAIITMPIRSAKITPEGPVVFTVTASSTLSARPIELDKILGDRVIVKSGLTPEMEIVTDARGLSDGQLVIVDAS